jgi:hypothetical protein
MNEMLQNQIRQLSIIIDENHTNDNVRSCLSIFYCHMIHTSTSLVLPCRSRCTVVGIAVDVLICAWGWSLICRLPWTPISVVPTLTTTVARSHNTSILCIIVPLRWRRCRARRLEVGALNLSLRSLKSFTCSLHSWLSTLLPRTEHRALWWWTNTESSVASMWYSVLHLSLSFHNSSSVFKD